MKFLMPIGVIIAIIVTIIIILVKLGAYRKFNDRLNNIKKDKYSWYSEINLIMAFIIIHFIIIFGVAALVIKLY